MIDWKNITVIFIIFLLFVFLLVTLNPFPISYKLQCIKKFEDNTFENFLMNPNGSSSGTLFKGTLQEWRLEFAPRLFWSSEGPKYIYTKYENRKSQLWMMNLDESEKKLLVEEFLPLVSFSKDGKKLLLMKEDGNDTEIWIMNWDGTGLKQLTDNEVGDLFPEFVLNDKKIVYQTTMIFVESGQEKRRSEIWVMNIDGSEKRRISSESKSSFIIQVSPDSKKIAYMEEIDETLYGLYIIKIDDSEKNFLEKSKISGELAFTSWSPTCNYIIYILQNEIWISSVDGKEKRIISKIEKENGGLFAYKPFFSPDESKIYYSYSLFGSNWEVWVVNIDGTGNKRISAKDTNISCRDYITYEQYLEIKFHQNLRFIKFLTIFVILAILLIIFYNIRKGRY